MRSLAGNGSELDMLLGLEGKFEICDFFFCCATLTDQRAFVPLSTRIWYGVGAMQCAQYSRCRQRRYIDRHFSQGRSKFVEEESISVRDRVFLHAAITFVPSCDALRKR